jgi:DNA mismatch repair protein MutL
MSHPSKAPRSIQALPKILADQIAAGEVIENPASVLKELVENAIDAQARKISVVIREGGVQCLQVSDDGVGMSREDVWVCVDRHTTSKIQTYQDLFHLRTHGFRGEALASMAAVSKLRIESGLRESPELACALEVDPTSGKTSLPCPPRSGTRVKVEHLFSWVPARKKYLKASGSELNRCLKSLWPLLLAHPGIEFEWDVDLNRSVQRVPPASSVVERFFQVFGHHSPQSCFYFGETFSEGWKGSEGRTGMRVRGFLASPSHTLGDSRHLFVSVNHRFVKWPSMIAVVRQLYREVDGKRGVPWGVIQVQVPPEEVDFNVDPKKESVRLVRETEALKRVHGLLKGQMMESKMVLPSAVRLAGTEPRIPGPLPVFEPRGAHPQTDPKAGPQTRLQTEPWLDTNEREPMERRVPTAFEPSEVRSVPDVFQNHSVFVPSPSFHVKETREQVPWGELRFVGTVREYIWVAEDGTHVYFLDPHAIHERIQYEQYLDALERASIPLQKLLLPESLQVDEETYHQVLDLTSELETLGFKIKGVEKPEDDLGKPHESRRPHELVLMEVPVFLGEGVSLSHVVGWVQQNGDLTRETFQVRRKELVGHLVCKRSIRRGDRLTPQEVLALFRQAETWLGPKISCQHGRPFVVKLAVDNLESAFLR